MIERSDNNTEGTLNEVIPNEFNDGWLNPPPLFAGPRKGLFHVLLGATHCTGTHHDRSVYDAS